MKQFVLLLLLIPGCIAGRSQSFHGGILLGFTASQVDGDSYAGFNKPGLQGGVFVTTRLTDGMDARLEIKYTSRGAKNPASDDNTGAYKLGLNYIDIPVLIAVKIKQLGSVEIGLVPGYLFAINGEDENGNIPEEYLVDFKKFDLGTLLGANINLSKKIAVNLRYSYSIFSIRDEESSGAYYSWFGKLFGHSQGDYNNYLTFGISYLVK
jgi:opacity protein-like surface antigen